jgi:hypothetical protein
MRRPLAILMVLFFALGPLQGVLEASDAARLPACCRRNGAHHCAMSENMMAALERAMSSSPAFTASATCPSFPGFALGFSTPSHALLASDAALPVLLEQAYSPIHASSDARLAPVCPRAGRAPPASL